MTLHRKDSALPITSLQRKMLEAIRQAGDKGLTDEELGERIGVDGRLTSQRNRVEELRKLGLIEPTGTTRNVASGRRASTWRATEQGKAAT